MATSVGVPIHQSVQVPVEANSDNTGRAVALRNPTDLPLEVRELKFQVRGSAAGAALEVNLLLGNDLVITNNFVPAFSFGIAKVYPSETDTDDEYAEFFWKLPAPFHLPPGGFVVPRLRNTGLVTTLDDDDPNATLTGIFSYSANTLARMPKVTSVPYVSAWASKGMDVYGTEADSDVSTEQDLVNSLKGPLAVQRFMGRTIEYNTTSGLYLEGNGNASLGTCQVQMVDSRGHQTVEDPVPFGQAFQRLTRSWECPHVVEPGDYYLANLTRIACTSAPYAYQFRAYLSMVGAREVRL